MTKRVLLGGVVLLVAWFGAFFAVGYCWLSKVVDRSVRWGAA